MREIKFRGKTMSDKFFPYGPSKWVYGFITQFPKEFAWMYIGSNDNRVMVHSDTVGQFTGLKDKDGVEIYEGDIVANDFGNGWIVNMEVKWFSDGGYWALQEVDGDETMHFLADYIKYIKIIGNIYDA